MGKGGPEPGDANLCIQCGHLMVFARDLSFREPTAAERAIFDRDPDIIKARIAIKLVHGRATLSPGPRRRQ